jgi:hypothetical protein
MVQHLQDSISSIVVGNASSRKLCSRLSYLCLQNFLPLAHSSSSEEERFPGPLGRWHARGFRFSREPGGC